MIVARIVGVVIQEALVLGDGRGWGDRAKRLVVPSPDNRFDGIGSALHRANIVGVKGGDRGGSGLDHRERDAIEVNVIRFRSAVGLTLHRAVEVEDVDDVLRAGGFEFEALAEDVVEVAT